MTVTTDGKARTAAATAARTRAKHDRWIAELAGAGWTVVQAASVVLLTDAVLEGRCDRCGCVFGHWIDGLREVVPLPRVLHAVSGHTCEERS